MQKPRRSKSSWNCADSCCWCGGGARVRVRVGCALLAALRLPAVPGCRGDIGWCGGGMCVLKWCCVCVQVIGCMFGR